MAGNNLVLGWLYDRSWEEVRAFVISAERAKMDAHVVILAWHNEASTWERIRDHGIEVIAVPCDYVMFETEEVHHRPVRNDLTHFISRRYCFYGWYLNQHREYDQVMLTGIRDVIIQSDPFEYNSGNALCCFLESRLIKKCNWNCMWLHDGFNQDELEKIHENSISCAEIVLGKSNRVTEYVKLMVPHICGPNLKIRVIDQAVHNYLLWNKMLGEVRLFKPGEGPVFTMGYRYQEREAEIIMNESNQVLNDDGTIASVIHQYDRFAINTLLRSVYS